MASRYVEVPAPAIRERLVGAGFVREPMGRSEEVYVRPHDLDPKYVVKIYSSIPIEGSSVRGCGADAIRVVALLVTEKKTYPIFKGKRVYRTGSVDGVLDRMIERARSAYAACNQHRKGRRR